VLIFAETIPMTDISKEALKSALIELSQSDRAFFVSLFEDILNGYASESDSKPPSSTDILSEKIAPPYRKNIDALREKYAMDKTVLRKLGDLFEDGPSAEEFLQSTEK